MDARVNLKGRGERSNIEIQRIRKDDETARALFYAGGLLTDFPKGIKKIPATKNTVIFICDFDPFENTPYAVSDHVNQPKERSGKITKYCVHVF